MPYESFKPELSVQIVDVIQDPPTNSWLYVIEVQRGSCHCSKESEAFSHAYVVGRDFNEFKKLHAELEPIMGSALTPLPSDGLITRLMADKEELLAKRREALDNILKDILRHSVAQDLPEVLSFLGHESVGAQVMAPSPILNGQCHESLRRSTSWSWKGQPAATTRS